MINLGPNFPSKMDEVDRLQREIAKREAELADLGSQLALAESKKREQVVEDWKWPLAEYEYERYSRQMIVPGFGLQGILPFDLRTIQLLTFHRATQVEGSQSAPNRRWWSGMSCRIISCRRWCWYTRFGGWR